MDPKLQEIVALDQAHYLNTFGNRTPVCFVSGQGSTLTDTAGKTYLDLIGGIAVNVLGHAHPRLTQAICEQAGRLLHCSNLYYIEAQARLAARLTALSGLDRAFFCNSGAEANEAAFKLARGYFHKKGTPRAKIISATQSFHGRTLATIAATGQARFGIPFAPLPPGYVHVPFNDIDALTRALDDDTCAVILEPVQGESGVWPADHAYMKAVAAACREAGALLILDEIQTGMGRTGRMFAFEHYGIRPDVVTMAKGLAGGVPAGACLATADAATGFQPGDHGTTFGGGPLACAAALAVLDAYEEQNLVAAAAAQGAFFREQLQVCARQTQAIAAVRGLGLMIGISLKQPVAARVKERCLEQGYLIYPVGDSILRLLPPLILTPEEITRFCRDLTAILLEVAPA